MKLPGFLTKYAFGVAALLLVAALGGCSGSSSSSSYAPAAQLSNATMSGRPATDAVVRAWGRSLTQVPLPGAGCFKASYPAMAWTRSACATAPRPPVREPNTVGDGADYAISVAPQVISKVIGSFPVVSGVKSEKTVPVKSFGGDCVCGPNAYTLQLNSNFYATTKACGNNSKCVGWEQFVFATPVNTNANIGEVFIQDWRIKATRSSPNLKCPAKNTGWQASGGDCYYSTRGVSVPLIGITDLSKTSLTAIASSTGDSAYLTVGTTVYGMKNLQKDFMDLDQNFTGAEFNIVGDCCGSKAVFNAGSKVTVSLEADDGSTAAPACLPNMGTTGETNSLSFVAAPSNPQAQQYPSILFTQSNVGGGKASCATVAGR